MAYCILISERNILELEHIKYHNSQDSSVR